MIPTVNIHEKAELRCAGAGMIVRESRQHPERVGSFRDCQALRVPCVSGQERKAQEGGGVFKRPESEVQPGWGYGEQGQPQQGERKKQAKPQGAEHPGGTG